MFILCRQSFVLASCERGLNELTQLLSANFVLLSYQVIEYQDPDSGSRVTGLLQAVTSLCAILSTVKNDKLLLVEKALLRHKSHGYILVPCDITSDKGDSDMLPFDLRECRECMDDEGTNKDGIDGKLSKLKESKDKKKGIVNSYIW